MAERTPHAGGRRVLHVIDLAGPGGAQRVLVDLCTNLDPARWTPVVAVQGPGWITERLDQAGVRWLVAPTANASFDRRYLSRLVSVIRSERADVVHAHLLGPAIYAGLAGLILRVPVVTTFHGQSDLSPDERFLAAKVAIINRAERLVFVSDALRRNLVDRTGVRPSIAAVVHNGIHFARREPGSRGALRAELGIRPDEVLVGAVGHVRPPKAYADFIRAAALLSERSDRYRFVIAGAADDADEWAMLHDLRDSLGLGEKLHFIGFRDDVGAIMRDLDVYVISSVTEGLSISTIEALDAHLPVVATRCGGPEEIIEHEVTGLLVPVGDAGEIAAAVDRHVSNPVEAKGMAAAGAADVRARFRIETMVERYQAIYDDAAR